MNDLAIAAYSAVGENLGPGQYLLQSPWGPFETSDGYVVIAVLMQAQWEALCEVIGRPELGREPTLATGVARSQNHEALVEPAVSEWTRARTKGECSAALNAVGVPAAPVYTPAEAFELEQTAARNMVVQVTNNIAGPLRLVGNPIKVDSSEEVIANHVPDLGEHTIDVLSGVLGMPADDIDALADRGVIRASTRPTVTER
jgi:formyl-CoA transferase